MVNDAWMQEHWVILVVFAAILSPIIGYLIKKAIDKAISLDADYLRRSDFESFRESCEKNRSVCVLNQDKCSAKIEKYLERIEKEIRANRLSIYWIADRMVGQSVDKKELAELRKIVEGGGE